jgi:hypothetical protein
MDAAAQQLQPKQWQLQPAKIIYLKCGSCAVVSCAAEDNVDIEVDGVCHALRRSATAIIPFLTVGKFRKTRHPRNVKSDKFLKTCFSGAGNSRFSEAWNL